MVRGDPAGAAAPLREALEAARRNDWRAYAVAALRRSAELNMIAADLPTARAQAEEAAALAAEMQRPPDVAKARIALGSILLEQAETGEAARVLGASADALRTQKRPDEEAFAVALLANALAGSDRERARSAAARALQLAGRADNRETRLVATTQAQRARLRLDLSACASALRALRSTAAEAHRIGFMHAELDARLAAGEGEVRCGQGAAGRARLAALEPAARARGFLLLAAKAARAAGR
jgi:hypothetical protein